MTRPLVLQNLRIVDPSRNLDETGTVIVGDDGTYPRAGKDAQNQGIPADAFVKDCAGLTARSGPGRWRVFVGEPGSEHRETIESASRAAATGGVTSFIVMPDTDPVIDDMALGRIRAEDRARQGARQRPSGAALTKDCSARR